MSVTIQTSFLREVDWVNQQIKTMREWQSKYWAVGLSWSTGQPDYWCKSFAERGLNIVSFVRGSKAAPDLGTERAYDQNIGTLHAYIERERQEEVQWARGVITSLGEHKARSWAIGLAFPGGQPDTFARSFAMRELPISYYLRGTVTAGDPSAYDKNIATLNTYLERIAHAVIG